jgi:hypothetical protein
LLGGNGSQVPCDETAAPASFKLIQTLTGSAAPLLPANPAELQPQVAQKADWLVRTSALGGWRFGAGTAAVLTTTIGGGRGCAFAQPLGVRSAPVTAPKEEGERVVLARRDKFNPMVPFHWSADAPPGLDDLEWAEELGAKWEGDELVTYDYPTFSDLLEYYEQDQYMPDND